MAHRVTAAAVRVLIGSRVHVLTRGSVLPDEAPAGDVERLVAKGLVAAIETAPEPKPSKAQAKPAAK